MAYDVATRKMKSNITKSIENAIHYADLFVSKNYLIDLGKNSVVKMEDDAASFTSVSLIEITKICYDPRENVQDKLKTVYTALYNAGSSVILVLKSNEQGVRFFIGVRDEKQPILARGILEKSLKGNFPGVVLSVVYPDEIEQIMTDSFPKEYNAKSIAAVSVIPGDRKSAQGFVQGLEKFIDTMAGDEYTALFIADPVDKQTLETKKRGYEKLSTSLSAFSNQSIAYGENTSMAVSKSLASGISDAVNEGVSDTVGTNRSDSLSKTRGANHGHGAGFFGMNVNSGHSHARTRTKATGESEAHTNTSGSSHTDSKTETEGQTDTSGSSITMTTQQQNKTILETMKKIDEQLGRIRQSESFGLFDVACYFSSSDKRTTLTAANTFKALVAGEGSGVENSFVNLWSDDKAAWERATSRACEYLRYGRHICVEYQGVLIGEDGEETLTEQVITPANMVNGMELPLILGLPMKSVNGVSVVTSAEFGRNVRYRSDSQKKGVVRTADMGAVYHMGVTWKKNRVKFDIDSLSGHCFITGTTGSGKSNTTYKLLEELLENGIHFLVIEPAKGEYKSQFGGLRDVNIFTTNSRYYEMLHLNPFEFPPDIHVAEHLDKLIQVFSACWPLYAAMPAILKEAFEKSYKRCGWDIHKSIHFDNGNGMFPTFRTLLQILPEIINTSAYSSDTKGDYTGSLVTRVKSLTDGLVGEIFCTGQSIDDEVLFEQNTILDLSRLQSDETISLIMGVMIMKLNEFRMTQGLKHNSALRHVTVLEEAHNILKKVSQEQDQEGSNVQGASVGMIRKSIAEMRTYGEGFIIIDQSPDEVDVAAIRNTNTKFIMKLSDKDDFETVGRTIGLNDEQILEIGKLPRGVAVAYQTEWEEPVLTMIDACKNTYEIKTHKANDLEAEKELLGALLGELLDQHEMGEYNLTWINSILNREKRVSEIKKQLFRKQIADLKKEVSRPSDKNEKLCFAKLLYELCQCGDLFEVYIPDIPNIKKFSDITPEIEKNCKVWQKQMLGSLDAYFELEQAQKEVILEYLMVHRIMLWNEKKLKIAIAILYKDE